MMISSSPGCMREAAKILQQSELVVGDINFASN